MKRKSKYLMSVILLLCVVFSSVLLAEYRDTGQGIMSETSKDRHKYEKRDRRMDLRTKDAIHQKQFQENGITNASSDAWKTETVDGPKIISVFSQRAIAVDSSSNPHIAYGGDYLYYAYYDGIRWSYETIDTSSGVGSDTSLALDKLGKVHISYYDTINENLKYATNASGAWVTTTVDSKGDVGQDTSLAIDTSGNVHISYYDASNEALKYATNASGAWATTTVDSDGDVGSDTSIAIDSMDKVHISYYDDSNDDLKYATNASGAWATTTVDSSGDVGRYTSLAIDTFGKIHISYYDYSQGDLKYATNASDAWMITTVDSKGYVGQDTSLAIDASGKVHISYYYDDYGDIKYATSASGAWATMTVDGKGDAGMANSLAIDASGMVHISYSYSHHSQGNLRYTTNTSGFWVITTIDSSGGLDTSLTIDASGNVHISYYVYSQGDLRYATNTSGAWVTTTVDSSGDVGEYTSLAIDTSGNVHISYYGTGDLKYATNASGSWVTTTVDSKGYVGMYTSLAIDAFGNVHISYYDASNEALKYATNTSGTWVMKTVDSGGVGWNTSIAMDSRDKAHISYFDYSNEDLKYATNASGKWVTTTVDSDGYVGLYTSIAIDSRNKVHISYIDGHYIYLNYGNDDLKYATNASGTWVTTTVDSDGYVTFDTAIAIDSSDKVHISYFDWSNKDLMYATNAFQSPTPTPLPQPAPKITGYVVDFGDNPVESAKVKLKGKKTGKNETTYSDEDGYFAFEDLKADTYTVTAKKKGYEKDKQTVVLDDGEDEEIKMKLIGETNTKAIFKEEWEKAKVGAYKPTGGEDLIPADEGDWFLGDTVSNFDDCGPTPHKAEIFKQDGSNALRLTSGDSHSSCADNVYVVLSDFGKYNTGFSIPFDKDTSLSFEETGELFNPEEHGTTGSCIFPPCFDNVSMSLLDARGNQLTYVFQRYPDAEPNQGHENYSEVFLDPDAGTYERNLFDDFLTIPSFDPSDTKGHKITSIELRVYEHGWAIFDNIIFGK